MYCLCSYCNSDIYIFSWSFSWNNVLSHTVSRAFMVNVRTLCFVLSCFIQSLNIKAYFQFSVKCSECFHESQLILLLTCITLKIVSWVGVSSGATPVAIKRGKHHKKSDKQMHYLRWILNIRLRSEKVTHAEGLSKAPRCTS